LLLTLQFKPKKYPDTEITLLAEIINGCTDVTICAILEDYPWTDGNWPTTLVQERGFTKSSIPKSENTFRWIGNGNGSGETYAQYLRTYCKVLDDSFCDASTSTSTNELGLSGTGQQEQEQPPNQFHDFHDFHTSTSTSSDERGLSGSGQQEQEQKQEQPHHHHHHFHDQLQQQQHITRRMNPKPQQSANSSPFVTTIQLSSVIHQDSAAATGCTRSIKDFTLLLLFTSSTILYIVITTTLAIAATIGFI